MYHEETLDAMRQEQRETDRVRAMLRSKAKLLGIGQDIERWYVLDGVLYCDFSHDRLNRVGEYHEECARFRRTLGKLPWE